MKNLDLISFYLDKNEHYPISDKFLEKYQKKDDEYVIFAYETGHIVNERMHEPNQKWHLFEAYFIYKLVEKDGDVEFRRGSFKCPELLLWLAEAADVNSNIVEEAATYASEKIEEIKKVSSDLSYSAEAVKYMNDKFNEKYGETLWEKTVNKINSMK